MPPSGVGSKDPNKAREGSICPLIARKYCTDVGINLASEDMIVPCSEYLLLMPKHGNGLHVHFKGRLDPRLLCGENAIGDDVDARA